MLTHRISATLLLFTTLSSSMYVISNNNWKMHFNTHGILGAFSSTCALFISIGGFTGLTLLQKNAPNLGKFIGLIKMAHRTFGSVVILVSQAAIFTGGYIYS